MSDALSLLQMLKREAEAQKAKQREIAAALRAGLVQQPQLDALPYNAAWEKWRRNHRWLPRTLWVWRSDGILHLSAPDPADYSFWADDVPEEWLPYLEHKFQLEWLG